MRTLLPVALTSSLLLSFACSSEPGGTEGTGGSAPGTGGENPGSGGANSTGGVGPGTGGAGPETGGALPSGGSAAGGAPEGTGGAAPAGGSGGVPTSGGTGGTTSTGGSGNSAFQCPQGSSELTPTLGTATAAPGTLPAMPANWTSILEGPVWRDGKLYLSEMRDYGPLNPSRLLSYDGAAFTELIPIVVDPQNTQTIVSDAGINGMAVAGDGRLFAASHAVGGIVAIDVTKTPIERTTIVAEFNGLRLNAPNDLTIRSDGVVYLSDPDWQCMGGTCPQPKNRVYYYAGGTLREIATDHMKPNGIALSPDESTLYVGGDGTLVSYPVMSDGSVGTASPFGNLTGIDGLAVDCAGNVYAALNGDITVLSPSGTSLGVITVPSDQTTNAAFGGPENKTLYITATKPAALFMIDVGIPGYPY